MSCDCTLGDFNLPFLNPVGLIIRVVIEALEVVKSHKVVSVDDSHLIAVFKLECLDRLNGLLVL